MSEQKVKLYRNPQFIMIFIIATVIYCTMQMLATTLPKFADDMGATAQAIGLLSGIFALCALFMRPVSGQIVDNEDKLVLLRVVLVFQIVALSGLSFSNKYWMLLLFRGLSGLSWGIGSTLCMTIATNCFTNNNMTTGVGIYGLGQILAQTIGPLIGLSIAEKFGYQNLYFLNTVLMILCMILTLLLRIDNQQASDKKYSVNIKDIVCFNALPPAILTMCNTIAKSAITAFLIIYADMLNVQNIGIFFTIQALVIFLTRPFIARLSDKGGFLKMLIPCEILLVVGLLVIAFSRNISMFILAAVLTGVSSSGEQPMLMAECVRNTDPLKRGSANNTNYIGIDVGMFLGSNLAGVLVAYLGYTKMFLLSTIPVIICTIIFIYLYIARERRVL